MPENDEKTIGKIKESLDFLDNSMEIKKPDFMQLVKLVNDTEEKKEQKTNKQFVSFLLSAILIVLAETSIFIRSAVVFAVVLQVAALIFILPVIVWTHKRRGQVFGK